MNLPWTMIYRCHCRGRIRLDLVQSARKRCLCVADCTALQLKGDIVVMDSKGKHAQEKARCQEQAYASPDSLTAIIGRLFGSFHNYVVVYGINTT
jgi:hypothetical protein